MGSFVLFLTNFNSSISSFYVFLTNSIQTFIHFPFFVKIQFKSWFIILFSNKIQFKNLFKILKLVVFNSIKYSFNKKTWVSDRAMTASPCFFLTCFLMLPPHLQSLVIICLSSHFLHGKNQFLLFGRNFIRNSFLAALLLQPAMPPDRYPQILFSFCLNPPTPRYHALSAL